MPGKEGWFFLGDTGEQILYAQWKPNPDDISVALARMASQSEDWVIPLEETKQAFIENTRHMFADETDPDGVEWTDLEEDYLEEKLAKGYPPNILIREGELYAAATDESNWHITERSIFFNTEALPFYGPYHQSGLPERKNPLPQRAFIGVTEQAADEADVIFTTWLAKLVEDFYDDPVWSGGMPTVPSFGDIVQTSKGASGALTRTHAFGGGFLVRGAGGRIVKGVFGGDVR